MDGSRPRANPVPLWQVILLAVLACRVVGFAAMWSQLVLNMDFSAYYTAGRSMNRGLDPYRNQVGEAGGEDLWDGVSRYRHSRFLYPPLVGHAFRPIALLPFPTAKLLWAAIQLAALIIGVALFAKAARQPLLPVLLLALASHPLLVHLERGQIDLVTFALLAAALWLTVSPPGSWRQWAAGACVAAATLVKLPCFLLLPFLALRRRWRSVGGFAATLLALIALDAILDRRLTIQYYSAELPRILRFGEAGPSHYLLPEGVRGPLEMAMAQGQVTVAGDSYQLTAMPFVFNASLARELAQRHCRDCPWLPVAVLTGLLAAAWALAGRGLHAPGGATGEVAYFLLACAVTLLASPLSWTMNTVWLFPGMLLLSPLQAHPRRRASQAALAEVGLAATVVGLGLLAVPDQFAFPLALPPPWAEFLRYKYVLSGLLLLVACGVVLRLTSAGAADARALPPQVSAGRDVAGAGG